ncbi:MAG TPA: transporter substrate-binding domain-containing protein [Candidatus Limnocylindrales bacterium]|nr:transporter substrate-binding domain-containing protein [Candidatus Limnocylindrales bacterium]
MDDERIERALRQGPPDEPAYVPSVARRVASERDATSAAGGPSAAVRPDGSPDLEVLRPDGVRLRGSRSSSRRSIPVAIAAALAIAIGGLLVWQTRITGPGATPAPSLDLLGRLRESGTIRIAVSSGPPQTVSAGGAYIGFDVDVAEAIAGELGLDADVSAVADFAAGEADLLLPGGTGAGGGAEASEPYAYWPILLAAGAESPVTDLASLAGARICVVEGSTGAAWLAAQGTAGSVLGRASDDECVAAVTDGSADAMVSESLLADELVSRGLRLVLPTPVTEEAWTAVAAPGSDSATLIHAVDRAIAKLRTSGRLEEISRSSFGGQDVTVHQP